VINKSLNTEQSALASLSVTETSCSETASTHKLLALRLTLIIYLKSTSNSEYEPAECVLLHVRDYIAEELID
jgi:hypothetical protein